MRRFNFKAKDRNGKLVSGLVEANDERHAASLIREKDLILLSLSSQREDNLNLILNKFKNRIKEDDVATFTRQLATMVNAGLPITESLLILKNQAQNAALKDMLTQILADVQEGQSLSNAIGKYPNVFSPTYIALLKAGEAGGVLDNVLSRLSDNMEKQVEFKGKVKGALIYPVIVVIGMVLVAAIMMIFVIPKMLSLYSEFGADLPGPTKVLMSVSGFFAKFWWLMLIIIAFLFNFFITYRKTKTGRRKIDELILKIPIFGDLQRQVALTELTRTLSLLVGAGVSILEALSILSQISGNAVIGDALEDSSKDVEKGFPLAYAFAKHSEAFPYILSQMVAVGEETGKMSEVLAKVSHVFEVESDQKVKALTSAIEPLVMIVLGIGVGFLVIAVILPIYNLTSQF
ncbi:MAG: phytochrome sensor protein [Patescibacteria group bacterium]|nr:MAG: phytochrome sensor protein [Patescibacteria group bacterium]